MDIYSTTLPALEEWLVANGEKPFRAKQIFQWLYEKNASSWEDMSNVSKSLRDALSEDFRISTISPANTVDSNDAETAKYLWKLDDNLMVESVLISSEKRRTVCVSTQVGCPARCAFCASGRKGFFRNLTTAEIVEQVVAIDTILNEKDERVSHVVFMGMGEPLENYDAVIAAIRLFIDPNALALSQRRITVSTVGVVEKIYALAEEGLKVNLVLSLHAPEQTLRTKIIPYAKRYDLKDILKAMDHYSSTTKRDITYEYTLLRDINDSPADAKALIALLRHRQCTVNLIPYNAVEGLPYQRPPSNTIKHFYDTLTKHKIITTCRYTKGDDINAACGQLALMARALPSPLPPEEKFSSGLPM
ncbi:MAG: 23S rRNA (adenine(2503)-C(2))-methyltransferase RlmN [Waddliaceae bacterium]|nr:23S rRNA (adenine(2503)-C(2))-methyltransferase RlmN [Waddliaceae bacterium]MBT4444517.1 23S rRNA (adenine(2503)-C(2))-methyltransferase RlmN [Waddliaceae bacterium]MBT6928627.1 23S rRNA (adenine(2503)-C(2))-methyltransferase RlmN [Waddliaceae bacterium]MBT7265165.1 23S rRNA (adenine(2503)-C(2))-methyltransferase RlmN [Waddliaceae bacterium]MBT7461169.1 23S rRNA (adenine(2503)-C(2))-methyltransferase RlmN [Waddliaceae bacterium]